MSGTTNQSAIGAELWADAQKRWAAFAAQAAELEEKALAESVRAIDEGARLWKEGVRYGARLSAEWRRVGAELTEKVAAATQPKG